MSIYISRHGESLNNSLHIIGGDSHLTEKGMKYGSFLGTYFNQKDMSVWISKLIRTKETVANINIEPIEWPELNEIDAGDFEGMFLNDIISNYPDIYYIRDNDKLNNSYPNGENYIQLYDRVIKVLKQIKDSDHILIVAHQAVCRIIYSYFTHKKLSECTNIPINLHTLYKLKNKLFTPVTL
jgi:broad specificity phosphatase PhoE